MSSSGGAAKRRIDQVLTILAVAVGLAIVASLGQGYGGFSVVVFVMFCGVFAVTSVFIYKMIVSLGDEGLDVTGRIVDTEREQLEREKRILLDGLTEFKADAAFGKIDKADYDHLRKTAEARAMQIIKRLKDTDAYWLEQATSLVDKRLSGRPSLEAKLEAKADGTAGDKTKKPVPAAEQAKTAKSASKAEAPQKTKPAADEAKAEAPKAKARIAAHPGVFDDNPVEFDNLACKGCDTINPEKARFCVGCGRPKKDAA